MENIVLRYLTLIIFIVEVIYFIKFKGKGEFLINEKFWVIYPWTFCLFMYYFSGIEYTYNLNFKSFFYILFYWICFFLGYLLTEKRRIKNNENKYGDFKTKLNMFPFFIISLISSFLYALYILKTNNIVLGSTRNIETNAFATIFLFLSNVSFVIWLYELAYAILNDKKIPLFGYASAIIYNLPVILISGRDALIIFIIATLIVIVYCGYYSKKILGNQGKSYKKIIKFLKTCFIMVILYMVFLSNRRYGSSSDAALDMFRWSSKSTFSDFLVALYYNLGGIGKLIINFLYYYTSQFSKFALIFEKYNGPYLYGFYELHYVSRHLPSFLNLNYELVNYSLQNIAINAGVPGIKVLWNTSIGHMIYDFGKIGALIINFILGFIVSKISSWNNKEIDIFKIIFQIFICVAMFLTIELSPIFDYFYIFPFAWFIIIKILYNRLKKEII